MRRGFVRLLCECVLVVLLAVGAAWGQSGHGSVVGWGQQVVGVDLSKGCVAMAGGWFHSLAPKADGSIVAWGRNDLHQCDVPIPNENFVGVAAGEWFSVGLKGYPYGDMNCDAAVNGFDIDAFVVALLGPDEYYSQYPDCDHTNADINRDGVVNGFDIDAFVELLIGG
ncbi:MAG: hypothetical protein KKB50_13145 [Planctomycetes bacterium]|nr:hypothetical protein [Planctomycetota bacterium]